MGDEGLDVTVANEFASVRVRLDLSGNGPRLEVCDPRSGRRAFLGPLELMSLAFFEYADLADVVNPERWYTEDRLNPRP